MSPPPLIPRDILFGNPQRLSPSISPDGQYLAYLAPDDRDVLQVWLRSREAADDRVLTRDKKRGIRSFFWTYDGDQLVYLQDADGDEDWHLYGVNIHTGVVRDLTPFQGIQARVVALDPHYAAEMLVGMNLRDPAHHDVYRVNLRNGAVEISTENPGDIVGWTADEHLQVKAAIAATPDGGWDLRLRQDPDMPWTTALHWGPDDEGSAVAFSMDGRVLYLLANHDSNATRLIELNVATKEQKQLAQDQQYDVADVLMHPMRRVPEAVGYQRDRLEWQVLDGALEADFEVLRQRLRGDFDISSRDLADATWLVSCRRDDGPTEYFVYDRASKTPQLLFSAQPRLEGLPLAAMTPVAFAARDGLELHGYLTLPPGLEPHALPALLLVHGGPWARDTWGYSGTVQWLANRGYAVLQVNFRGSTGYGKKFLHAGDREWGAAMQDDLTDGAAWLVSQGIADAARVGIMGGYYGGYATLAGLAFSPGVFACGVDIVGPSNLVTLLATVPPYWAAMRGIFTSRVGDLTTEEEFLQSRSPLFHAGKIEAPLLIGQGANDPRVKVSESEQIVEAMSGAGKAVEYVVYADEGHGFARPENRLHFHALAEAFLARHLGGRCEPEGALSGHTASVVQI